MLNINAPVQKHVTFNQSFFINKGIKKAIMTETCRLNRFTKKFMPQLPFPVKVK